MQLGLLAGLLGLGFAVWTIASARSISARRSAPIIPAPEKEPPNPFDLSPPAVDAVPEGTIQSHPLEQIQEMAL